MRGNIDALIFTTNFRVIITREEMKVQVEYISAGCNQVPHVLSVRKDILLYGACNAVVSALIDAKLKCMRVDKSVVGHSGRVNCIKWLNEQFFVSGATDKTVCLWKNFEVEAVLKGHEESVTCVDGLIEHDLVVTSSADSTLKIWGKNLACSEWICTQSIACPKQGFVLDISVIDNGERSPWIIASFDDCSIRVFSCQNGKYDCIHILR